MARSLGIFVTTDRHMDKIIGLAQAAKAKGVENVIFLTHRGVLLTQHERFGELVTLGRLSLCNVGFESHKLTKPVTGLSDKDYATQARHGEMVEDCDRYVVF